jgi:hypothetical protein
MLPAPEQATWWGPDSRGGDAGRYDVRIDDAHVRPGGAYWRAVRVCHLSGEENRGNGLLLIDILNESGKRIPGARALVSSSTGEEVVTIANSRGRVPIYAYGIEDGSPHAVEVLGLPAEMLPSERVGNIHSDHPEEPQGNSRLHHTFLVVFQKTSRRGSEYADLEAATASPPSDHDEVQLDNGSRADEEIEASSSRPITEYVLFGQPDRPSTKAKVLVALDYLLERGPMFGYDVREAELAQSVLIVAETDEVSLAAEASLAAAGCKVTRVEGGSRVVQATLSKRLE